MKLNLANLLMISRNLLRLDLFYSIVTLLFIIICSLLYKFYPKATYEGDLEVVVSMENKSYKYILVAVISITSFMLMEFFMDIALFLYKKTLSNNEYYEKIISIPFLVLLLLFIFSSITFFIAIPNTDYYLLLFMFHIKTICLFSATLFYMYTYGGIFWNNWTLGVVFIIGGVGTFLKEIAYYQATDEKCLQYPLYRAGSALIIIAIMLYISFFIRWLILLYNTYKISKTILDDHQKCFLFALNFFLTAITVTIPQLHYTLFTYPAFYLIINEIAVLGYVIFLHIYESRAQRQETDRYKEELEFKRMFVRYISHEVRTPLNTVMMGLQVLMESLRDDKDNYDTLRDIRTSCDIAVNTLNELLTFDKLEAGNLMLEKSRVNAMALIKSVVAPFQVQARQASVTLTVKPQSSDLLYLRDTMVDVDQNKISQILRNLVSNGLKFTPAGGTVTVHVSLLRKVRERVKGPTASPYAMEGPGAMMETWLKIDVADTGAGISAENQKRLFREIIQFSPGKLQAGGGSGLGLYISSKIAALHDGQLAVWSQGEGQGSTFTLTIPISIAAENKGDGDEFSVRVSPSLKKKITRKTQTMGDVSFVRGSIVTVNMNGSPNRDMSIRKNSMDLRLDGSAEVTFRSSMQSTGPLLPYNRLSFYMRKVTPEHEHHHHPPIHHQFSPDGTDSVHPFHSKTSESIADMTVLIVDDASTSRKMQCRLLRKRNCQCLEAENGVQAVDLIAKSLAKEGRVPVIDLVLMDSVMPLMSGPEATLKIREKGYKGIIIGVTGNVSPEDIKSFIEVGADAVLGKPLDMETFDHVVVDLLENNGSP